MTNGRSVAESSQAPPVDLGRVESNEFERDLSAQAVLRKAGLFRDCSTGGAYRRFTPTADLQYGELTLVQVQFVHPTQGRMWLCRCECGHELVRPTSWLNHRARRHRSASCPECMRELRRAVRHARRQDRLELFRERWATTGSLYTHLDDETMRESILRDLQGELGPIVEEERVPCQGSWESGEESAPVRGFGKIHKIGPGGGTREGTAYKWRCANCDEWFTVGFLCQRCVATVCPNCVTPSGHCCSAPMERTLEDVAKSFGVTRERIRQMEAKALRKLRHPSRRKHLEGFTDRRYTVDPRLIEAIAGASYTVRIASGSVLHSNTVKATKNPRKLDPVRRMRHAEWTSLGERLYGGAPRNWVFRCVNCGNLQSQDSVETRNPNLKGSTGWVYFACEGRFTGGVGCDWTLGGRIRSHELEIVEPSGTLTPVFEFADDPCQVTSKKLPRKDPIYGPGNC